MEINLFRGLLTAILLLLFIALIGWTWSRKRSETFEQAANLPLEDDSSPPRGTQKEQDA